MQASCWDSLISVFLFCPCKLDKSYQKRLEKTLLLKVETVFLEENAQDNVYSLSVLTSPKMKKNKV